MAADPAKTKEVDNARADAQLAILKVIGDDASQITAPNLKDLAEAFAWIHAPGQPH
jgi:hypothetical protein